MKDWNTDAQFADIIDERFLGTNSQIDNFLSAGMGGKFLVVASKGMGKTLLLRHKRKHIEENHKDFVVIPRGQSADYVILPNSPTKGLLTLLEDHAFWQDLWTISIATSALLSFPHKLSEIERAFVVRELDRAELPITLEAELTNALSIGQRVHRNPSSILDILLQSEIKTIARARAKGQQVLISLFNSYITSGCAIFIDSFDQAINTAFPENLKIWCNGQTGLLKAAWELSRNNRHAKIYITLRQEAYSSYRDPEKNNIKGSALLIEYTEDDLRSIFAKAVMHYEGLRSIGEFLGVEKIYNGYLRIQEDSFSYLCRHTIGVPRWLMVIGEAISNTRQERGLITKDQQVKKQQKLIAGIVNDKSAELGVDYLVDEMKAFYKGGTPEKYIESFLASIGSTVLSLSALKRIRDRFISCGWIGTEHPFCLLYNLGLLGHVAASADGVRNYQKFRRPYQFDWMYDSVLPDNSETHYLLHPSIHSLVQTKNGCFRFNKILIGNGIQWTKKMEKQLRKETLRIFISYAHEDYADVSNIASVIEEHLSAKSVLHDIWLDKWKMKAGKLFHDQMSTGLTDSDYLVLIVSKASMASSAVAIEWKTKFSSKIKADDDRVFPFLLQDSSFADLPEYLRDVFAYKYDGGKEKVIRLVDDMLFWHSSLL